MGKNNNYTNPIAFAKKLTGRSLPVFILFISICLFPAIPNVCFSEIVDRIVCIVNEDIITLSDIEAYMKPYRATISRSGYTPEKEQALLQKVRKDLLNQLIEEKLTEQETRRTKIRVTDGEIDKAIARFRETQGYSEDALEQALAGEGMTLEMFREKWRMRILRGKLVNREVTSGVVVTREDVESYYNEHPELYGGEKKYLLRNIVLKIPQFSSAFEKDSVKKKMEKILERIDSGESFKTLADQYSEVKLGEGGELGEFKLEDLSPEIREAVSSIGEGEHTGIVETDWGYQVFLVEKILTTGGQKLDAVYNTIEEKLYRENVDKKFREWLENLRKRSYIKIIE